MYEHYKWFSIGLFYKIAFVLRLWKVKVELWFNLYFYRNSEHAGQCYSQAILFFLSPVYLFWYLYFIS